MSKFTNKLMCIFNLENSDKYGWWKGIDLPYLVKIFMGDSN